jgi:hypothetical protein
MMSGAERGGDWRQGPVERGAWSGQCRGQRLEAEVATGNRRLGMGAGH